MDWKICCNEKGMNPLCPYIMLILILVSIYTIFFKHVACHSPLLNMAFSPNISPSPCMPNSNQNQSNPLQISIFFLQSAQIATVILNSVKVFTRIDQILELFYYLRSCSCTVSIFCTLAIHHSVAMSGLIK